MTHEQFCYWLQGFAEVNGYAPTAEQWEVIKEHLQATYVKATPSHQPVPPMYPDPPNHFFGPAICSAQGVL